jgi:hypothetical protein
MLLTSFFVALRVFGTTISWEGGEGLTGVGVFPVVKGDNCKRIGERTTLLGAE